jgi:hypothetical protein
MALLFTQTVALTAMVAQLPSIVSELRAALLLLLATRLSLLVSSN